MWCYVGSRPTASVVVVTVAVVTIGRWIRLRRRGLSVVAVGAAVGGLLLLLRHLLHVPVAGRSRGSLLAIVVM